MTARQFGGALGIAAMATILTHGGHLTSSTAAYSHVYVFCTSLPGLAFVIAALWLRFPLPQPRRSAPAPR
jgi:hypothetical protein